MIKEAAGGGGGLSIKWKHERGEATQLTPVHGEAVPAYKYNRQAMKRFAPNVKSLSYLNRRRARHAGWKPNHNVVSPPSLVFRGPYGGERRRNQIYHCAISIRRHSWYLGGVPNIENVDIVAAHAKCNCHRQRDETLL